MTDFDWKHPQYAPVFQERARRLARIRERPEMLPGLKRYYRDNPAQFITDWGLTADPRNVEVGLPAIVPFMLFPRQVEWVDWVLARWRAREPGVTAKSRESGVSWLAVALACTLCNFYDDLSVGFGSRKLELVDEIGAPKSLFWKARQFMTLLPVEFSNGWSLADAPFKRIKFPATGSAITGEGGDDIGRGDRQGIYFVDEAQPLSAAVLTPSGCSCMADMAVGSLVIGSNGRPTRVRAINDAGTHDVFRVTFSDGTSTKCSPNHVWTVDKVWGARRRLQMRTCEIAHDVAYRSPGGQTQYKYRVPVTAPVEWRHVEFPLDPYVVGVLIGDGSTNTGCVRLTSADPEIFCEVDRLLPEGVRLQGYDGRYTYNVSDVYRGRLPGGAYHKSRAIKAVVAAGIRGKVAHEKNVPDRYKFASVNQRLAVLQGLMDTDGSATGGSASFYSTSRRLAEDVRFLVQSLGGTATMNVKPDVRGHRDLYDVHLNLPKGMVPFRLSRKIRQWRPRRHPLGRTIVAVELVGREPVRCISVEAEDGLYLTDHCIVTHNSAFLERPQLAEASLSATTNCRIDISTPNGIGNPFHRKVTTWPAERVFRFHWRDDPRKDDAWYAKQLDELDPVTVAQEIDIDFAASVEGVLIPSAWVQSAVDAHVKLGLVASGARVAALDVADEGRDANAFASAHGLLVDYLEEWSGKGSDIYATVQKTFTLCDLLGLSGFRYDADGLGAGVRGDARILNEQRIYQGQRDGKGVPLLVIAEPFRGSGAVINPEGKDVPGRTNADFFANLKAQSWWTLRRRFQQTHRAVNGQEHEASMVLSLDGDLPNLQRLMVELSQPTYSINQIGKIVVDKAPDGTASPNLADAVMILMGRARATMTISTEALAGA